MLKQPCEFGPVRALAAQTPRHGTGWAGKSSKNMDIADGPGPLSRYLETGTEKGLYIATIARLENEFRSPAERTDRAGSFKKLLC